MTAAVNFVTKNEVRNARFNGELSLDNMSANCTNFKFRTFQMLLLWFLSVLGWRQFNVERGGNFMELIIQELHRLGASGISKYLI